MAKDYHHTKIKPSAQVTLEMTLAIILVAILAVFSIGIWERMVGKKGATTEQDEGIIPLVRWFENQRLDLADETDPKIPPEAEPDFSNLDAAIEKLNKRIDKLNATKSKLLNEAATARYKSLNIRTNNISYKGGLFGSCKGYYYKFEHWAKARGETIQAIFKEDAAGLLGKQIDKLTYIRDRCIEARDLIAQGTEEAIRQARAILASLVTTSTPEELLREQIRELRAQADALDQEAIEVVNLAGNHWCSDSSRNRWGSNAKAEAIEDEGRYEEGEAKSTAAYSVGFTFRLNQTNHRLQQGLAQFKRQQADELEASLASVVGGSRQPRSIPDIRGELKRLRDKRKGKE